MELISFLAGLIACYGSFYSGLAVLVVLLFFRWRYVLVFIFICAYVFAWSHEIITAPMGIPKHVQSIPHAFIEGQVVDVPKSTKGTVSFLFKVSQINGTHVNALINMSWYRCTMIPEPGSRWQLNANIKEIHDLKNEGVKDAHTFFQVRHTGYTGTVKTGVLISNAHYSIDGWRFKQYQRLKSLFKNQDDASVLAALTLGLSQDISQSYWDLFRKTGTTHLMVISGAHIGLVAGFVFWLIRWGWSRKYKLCIWMPAQQAAAIGSMIAALLYAIISGMAVPAERATICALVVYARFFYIKPLTAWQGWQLALWLVLLIEPHAILQKGTVLSFLAVASLLIYNQYVSNQSLSLIKKTFGLQIFCMIGLMPLTLYWFSYASICGLLANSIAIPMVGFILVPISLSILILGSIPLIGFILTGLFKLFLLILIKWLKLCALLSWFDIQWTPWHAYWLVPAYALILLSLFPLSRMLVPAVLALLFSTMPGTQPALKDGNALVYVLDVGQGLSVFVETAHHHLLYDTGDKFMSGSDMGTKVVLPFLRHHQVRFIDRLVISHPDKDHMGGMDSIRHGMPINDIFFEHDDLNIPARTCHEALPWVWDGVQFQFLAIAPIFKEKNNHSCVLKITTKQKSMLLTGDIERIAEAYLIKHHEKNLKANILLAPHHGSKGSSTMEFLKQVDPDLIVISSGFANRFKHPHEQTLKRYQTRHIPWWNTAEKGMFQVRL